ncbi:MAG: NADH-quinone oxidoreductase subunit J [Methylococcales bacterium]|jgi:NADH dehydrogenase subunit J (EC 1.6.5.3)|nr:NADH-quinone oxidoreductase subunit J [Methylococcaceae bacterium]
MESLLIYVAASVAIISSAMVITQLNAVHALLYLILSLLAVGIIFYLLGAHFAAVLEVIIYAGAIMVLFVFVVMMLNLGNATIALEQSWIKPRMWLGPSLLAVILLSELILMFSQAVSVTAINLVDAKQVGILLFGPYLLAVELASMLLLAGLIGAYHLGRRQTKANKET